MNWEEIEYCSIIQRQVVITTAHIIKYLQGKQVKYELTCMETKFNK